MLHSGRKLYAGFLAHNSDCHFPVRVCVLQIGCQQKRLGHTAVIVHIQCDTVVIERFQRGKCRRIRIVVHTRISAGSQCAGRNLYSVQCARAIIHQTCRNVVAALRRNSRHQILTVIRAVPIERERFQQRRAIVDAQGFGIFIRHRRHKRNCQRISTGIKRLDLDRRRFGCLIKLNGCRRFGATVEHHFRSQNRIGCTVCFVAKDLMQLIDRCHFDNLADWSPVGLHRQCTNAVHRAGYRVISGLGKALIHTRTCFCFAYGIRNRHI